MRWPQQNSGDPSTLRPGPSLGAPPLFSPTYPRFAFPAAASAAVVSEHPCVKLDEWWLALVEGDDRKIAIAGFFERNQAVLDFTAAPIAKRHKPYVLETDNGTVVFISGSFNIDRTLENGFTIKACEKFSLGFPQWWEKWNMLYPKMMSSQTGSQTRSSRTGNSHVDSSRFYLQRFQEGKLLDSFGTLIYNVLNNAEAFLGNGDAFPDSSQLPNGAARFEEYTCDDDIPTIEKSAASNHDSNKVQNMETNLIGASTLKEGSHDGTDSSIPSASMECTSDEGNAGIDNASCINNGRQKTHVASFKRRGCLKKPQCVALSELVPGEDTSTLACSDVQSLEKGKQPVGPSRKKKSTFGKLQRATRSPKIISPIPYDGSISAIIGLDSPPPLRGTTSRNYARKKKRTN